MSAELFADTNLLVYARDSSEPEKQPRAHAWMQWLWQHQAGRLSTQVLQEYYVTVTHKLSPGLAEEDARADVRALFAWRPLGTDAVLFERAWQLRDRYTVSWWDALIVAAAQAQGCRYLLTEDMQEGQTFDALRVASPFAHAPGALT